MTDKETKDKDTQNTKKIAENAHIAAVNNQDDENTSGVINLQKRKGDVEATRYGDWELNGRCIDF